MGESNGSAGPFGGSIDWKYEPHHGPCETQNCVSCPNARDKDDA